MALAAASLVSKKTTGFLLLLLVVLSHKPRPVLGSFNYTTRYRQVSSLRLARIHRHLDGINKPPVVTIKSPDGDIIDCVHKRKQPALDHPLLKNHKMQRIPPQLPRGVKRNSAGGSSMSVDGQKGVWQMWHQAGQKRCPNGTVPIRRSSVHDVLRAKSLYEFGKKKKESRRAAVDRRVDAPDVVGGNGHEVINATHANYAAALRVSCLKI